jgi:DNA polymerase-3 subunit gamma/tau
MSYQVLARKYRPRTFDELVGQEHVSRPLVQALDQDRLHHAYLFTGTRGVGKTTIARILSRCLNCESGVSSQPCGECDTCREISEGRFVDLIEVDAASRTKVEDTRELLDNVQYAPTRGRYKVYLIDEVHMLSAYSFNALLKTLEEPPPHVKFLLATTDPQRVPVTILSRCLQFNLKAVSVERIAGHLQALLDREMIPYEEAALRSLARAAQGSLRDALSLTDQAIAFGGERLSNEYVDAMLGSVDRDQVRRLLEALAGGEAGAVLEALDRVSEHSPDEVSLLDALIGGLHQLAVAQALPEREEDDGVRELAGRLSAESVQLFYDVALRGRRDLTEAPDARAALEMILLRMLLFTPEGVLPPDGDQPAKKSEAPAGADAQTPAGEAPDAARANIHAVLKGEGGAEPAPEPEPEPREMQESGAPGADAETEPGARPAPEPEPAASVEPGPGEDPGSWWAALTDRLELDGAARNLARNCVLVEREDRQWHLALRPGHQVLLNDARVAELEQGLQAYLGHAVRLRVTVDEQASGTPDERAAADQRERAEQARRTLQEDPVVRELIQEFDGRLDEASIRPRDE